jgi:hypothetical protein
LVNNRGGTYVPTELIFARTWVRGFNVKLKLSPHLGCIAIKNNEPLQRNLCSLSQFILSEKRTHVTFQLPVVSC